MRTTLQVGDTAGAIARRFGTRGKESQRLTGIQDLDDIFAGQTPELPEPGIPQPPQEAGEADANG